MKIRFQADADIDPDIRRGLLRREPLVDFRSADGIIPDGTLDPEVLHIAAEDDRVLVSGDLRTMSVHFRRFIARRESPGVCSYRQPGRLERQSMAYSLRG